MLLVHVMREKSKANLYFSLHTQVFNLQSQSEDLQGPLARGRGSKIQCYESP